jgi:hypothetical protein
LTTTEQTYYVVLNLDYKKGKAYYQTSKVSVVHGGMEEGFLLPSEVRSMLSKEFVKRFIFDGELANKILTSSSKEAEEAITYLYQLNKISELDLVADRIVESAQQGQKATSAKTENSLRRFVSERNSYLGVKTALQKKEQTLKNMLKDKEGRVQEIKETISATIRENNHFKEELVVIEGNIIQCERKVVAQTSSVLNLIRNPHLLHPLTTKRLTDLASQMQILKLPKTMSKQFFVELSEQDFCICGRPLSPKEQNHIREVSETYLAEDQIGILNAIKATVLSSVYSDELEKEISELDTASQNFSNAKKDKDRIKVRYNADESNNSTINLDNEQIRLEKEIGEIKKHLHVLTTKNRTEWNRLDPSENIFFCEDKLNDLNIKIAALSNTLSLIEQKKIFSSYLKRIEKEALLLLKSRIIQETQDKIKRIIKNEEIQIESIDGHIKLKDKSGASEGQTLAIAYSFLGSLFEGAAHKLPFVVDSPAGSLDLSVRREVSLILPCLFSQLIIFITSGERKAFTDYFYTLGENEVKFLTVYRSPGSKRAQCIEGVEMFSRFQESEEDIV